MTPLANQIFSGKKRDLKLVSSITTPSRSKNDFSHKLKFLDNYKIHDKYLHILFRSLSLGRELLVQFGQVKLLGKAPDRKAPGMGDNIYLQGDGRFCHFAGALLKRWSSWAKTTVISQDRCVQLRNVPFFVSQTLSGPYQSGYFHFDG